MVRKLSRVLSLIVFLLISISSLRVPAFAHASNTSVNSINTIDSIKINEVLFYPKDGEFEWVELKNTGTMPVDIRGWGLTDEDGNWYKFPHVLPDVPAGDFVMIILDGLSSDSNDYDFSDHIITLHSQPGLVDIFEDKADQVSLYKASEFLYLPMITRGGATETLTAVPSTLIASFVAWGAEPNQDAGNAIQAAIWFPDWYVSLNRSSGIESNTISKGETIGLLPDSLISYPDNWDLFSSLETTKGAENLIPAVSWYIPEDGAIIGGSTIAVGWNPVAGSTGYHFQLDDTADFSSLLIDAIVTESRYITGSNMPTGKYYWRVQVNYPTKMSSWSKPVYIELVALPQQSTTGIDFYVKNSLSSNKVLHIPWQLQHKDTWMLDLEGSPEYGQGRWDAPHVDDYGNPVRANNLDDMYCVRASTSMFASYYGGHLSQDRISYEFYRDKEPGPESDLGHGHGPEEQEVLNWLDWALGDPHAVTYITGKPAFSQIKQWIDENRAIASATPKHVRVIDGYEDGTGYDFIHLLDPWIGPYPQEYSSDPILAVWVGPAGSGGAPNVRSDEDTDGDGIADTIDDSDGDGVVDFDEIHRFPGLNAENPDSDDDGVDDKRDMLGYLFDNSGNYSWQDPDIDRDGRRKEVDWDNDNGGGMDGCEDFNLNGKYEPSLGETDNFDPTQEISCYVNLAPNPSFEYGDAEAYNWRTISTGAKYTWSTSIAHTGSYSLCISNVSAYNEGRLVASHKIPIFPGQSYTMSVLAIGNEDLEAAMSVSHYDNNGNVVSTYSSDALYNDSEWSYTQLDYHAEENVTFIGLNLWAYNYNGKQSPSAWVCFDDVFFTKK